MNKKYVLAILVSAGVTVLIHCLEKSRREAVEQQNLCHHCKHTTMCATDPDDGTTCWGCPWKPIDKKIVTECHGYERKEKECED